jgi:hypothetical protein
MLWPRLGPGCVRMVERCAIGVKHQQVLVPWVHPDPQSPDFPATRSFQNGLAEKCREGMGTKHWGAAWYPNQRVFLKTFACIYGLWQRTAFFCWCCLRHTQVSILLDMPQVCIATLCCGLMVVDVSSLPGCASVSEACAICQHHAKGAAFKLNAPPPNTHYGGDIQSISTDH